MMALHYLWNGRAQLVGDDDTLTPLELHSVPWLLLAAIVDNQINSSELARRGESATVQGICDRLAILKLVEHVDDVPHNMRLKLWDGHVVAVRVVGARFSEELHVQFEGERACSITTFPVVAVRLTWSGQEVCERLWPATPTNQPPKVELNKPGLRIRVRSKWYNVTDGQFDIFEKLYGNCGAWTPYTALKAGDKSRPDKIIDAMPAGVRAVIDRKRPNGCRIKPEVFGLPSPYPAPLSPVSS